ncbi:MAG: hypothetical protein IPK13_06875 [Deltaproteobacteria bacterium]|nr:hypothetical protein [Deltaproteobacteria bacterium]
MATWQRGNVATRQRGTPSVVFADSPDRLSLQRREHAQENVHALRLVTPSDDVQEADLELARALIARADRALSRVAEGPLAERARMSIELLTASVRDRSIDIQERTDALSDES